MASTRPRFSFGIVHRQHGLLPVQINLKVRAFAGFEDRSLLREPTLELFARHVCIINNIVYIGNQRARTRLFHGSDSQDAPAR